MANSVINVKVDFQKIHQKISPSSILRGETAMASQAKMDMERYVPMRGGALRSSAHTVRSKVIYNTVYARAQFYGTNGIVVFRKYTVPGTGKRWDLAVPSDLVNRWGKIALKGMGINGA